MRDADGPSVGCTSALLTVASSFSFTNFGNWNGLLALTDSGGNSVTFAGTSAAVTNAGAALSTAGTSASKILGGITIGATNKLTLSSSITLGGTTTIDGSGTLD